MSSDYQYLKDRQFKGLIYDWDLMLNQGDNKRFYCLTDFQAMWLLSTTELLSWKTRWENCPCTDEDLLAMTAELDLALMSCVDYRPFENNFVYQQAVGATLNAYDESYDSGGIPELNPNTPTDFYSGDDSDDRLNALCTACNVYIKSYATNWIALAQAVLGITVVVAFGLSLTGVGGVIAGTILAGLALFTQTALDAMNDETAIDNVICCMNTSLESAVINQDNFEESLDACAFDVGSHEQIIVDIISSDMNQFDNWLSFLNNLGDSYVLAQIGVLDCPCLDYEWSKEWDFKVEKGDGDGWQQVTWGDGWFSGLGWRSQNNGGSQNNYVFNFMPNPSDVTFIRFEFGNSGSPTNFAPPNGHFIVIWTWFEGSSTERVRYDSNGTPVNTTIQVYNNPIPIEIDQFGTLCNPWGGGDDWYVTKCTIRGNGVNPYD